MSKRPLRKPKWVSFSILILVGVLIFQHEYWSAIFLAMFDLVMHAGGYCNWLVMFSNDGKMPVVYPEFYTGNKTVDEYRAARNSDLYPTLCDRFYCGWGPNWLRGIYSVGDFLLIGGAAGAVITVLLS